MALLAVVFSACGGGGASKPVALTTSTSPAPAPSSASTASPAGSAVPPGPSPCGGETAVPTWEHVVWIWMENHSYRDVIGSPSAPYESALARQCGSASHYADVAHPSLPNYLAATSGDTQGVGDDDGPSSHPLSVDNLFRQVRAAGRTERSFEEGMPGHCYQASAGRYAVKHNPAAYYVGGGDRAACQADDLGFTGTLSAGPLPTFSFVTPDLCHDTHDCSVATGDAWLKTFVPDLLQRPEYRRGAMAVFVVWDESTPMPFIMVSPTTPPGTVLARPVDHYALLRTTEELLGLPLLGQAGSALSMRAAFRL